MKSIFLYLILFIAFNSCSQTKNHNNGESQNEQYNQVMKDLYKTVKYREQKKYYDIKIYNGACNYKIWINDIPVFNMYSNARGQVSIPINGKILKSGKQQLKIKIFPFYDENRNLKDKLNVYAGLDVTVRKMEWNSEDRIFNYTSVFEYQTPREGNVSLDVNPAKLLLEDEKGEQYYEEKVTFEVTIAYNLKGWSESVNLKNENKDKLLKEVEEYYQELSNDFKNKKIKAIANKYYNKEKEVAQSYFHNEKEAKTRWSIDILERIIDSTAELKKLENYNLKFFGNGKVVALMRSPGKSPLCVVTKKEDGKSRYSVYDVFLHRPRPNAPLEMIR